MQATDRRKHLVEQARAPVHHPARRQPRHPRTAGHLAGCVPPPRPRQTKRNRHIHAVPPGPVGQTIISIISQSVVPAVSLTAPIVNQAVLADVPAALRLVGQAAHLRAASHARRRHRLGPLGPPRQTTARPHELTERIRTKAHQRARTPAIHHHRLRSLYQSPLTRIHEFSEEPDTSSTGLGSTAPGRSGSSPAVGRSRSEQGRHHALDHTRQSRTRHHPRQHRQCVPNAPGTVGSAPWRQGADVPARTTRHGRLGTVTFEHMYRIAFRAPRNNPRNHRESAESCDSPSHSNPRARGLPLGDDGDGARPAFHARGGTPRPASHSRPRGLALAQGINPQSPRSPGRTRPAS